MPERGYNPIMLKIKLSRIGAKRKPSYRLVVAEARAKRNGKVVDYLGFYDPKTQPPTIKIDQNRFKHWVSQGAQLTESVRKILK